MLSKSDLRSYQLKAVDYILEKKRCGLAIDMGLGKTIIALTSFVRLHNYKVKKVLIIAPLNVAKNVWGNEISKWEHTRHLSYSICCGTEKERLENLKKEVDIYIINQENIEWMRDQGFDKYGMIVVDESHKFKNHGSSRFKALKKFTYKYIVLLSGTPMPQGFADMWSQQFLIDKGESIGHNITTYRSMYFRPKINGYGFDCVYPELISKRLSTRWLYMRGEDYLTLPDKIDITISIEIDNYYLYESFEKEYYLEIQNKELTAVNAGVLCNKLLQYCNGAVYDENKEYVEIHDNKLDMLEELIEDHPEENVLVAFNFKSDEERIKKRLKEAITLTSKNINEIERQWNNGEIKLLLCQCNSAEGLNLQQGGRIIIWFGLTWRMDSYKQFNARLHRQGQTKPVLVYHLVSKDCKDEEVMKVLANKNATQEDLFEVLKNDQSTKE
jgi:SNF2 family DNA or RNA helicase